MEGSNKGRTREVLERLKAEESKPKVKFEDIKTPIKERPTQEQEKTRESSSFYQQRLDRVMSKLSELERKMKVGDNFFTNYWDYINVSKEFMHLLNDFEKFDTATTSPQFKRKVEETKVKVLNKLNKQEQKTKNHTDVDFLDKFY